MRAGTSWLAAHLARHPAVYLPRKEIHFFDRKLDRRRIPLLPPDTEARLRYGIRFAPGALRGRLSGEVTPAYAVLERERIAVVRRWMPSVRLLFIMRDPVERAWSQAKHDLAHFKGLDAGDLPRSELTEFFERAAVLKRGDYATCIENWLRFFEREQLFVTSLEEVVSDPEAVLRGAFSFLGVNPDQVATADIARPVHAGERTAMPEWARDYLAETLHAGDRRLEALVGRLPWESSSGAVG